MSDSNRGRGTSKLVFRLTQYLWYVGGVQCIITTLYFLYFCWTRQLVFTYFASPATYGLLTSEHFVSLQWWIFSLTALCIPPLYWMGLMLGHYYTRWMKMVWCYFMVPAELALWLITLAVDIYWITTKNDPAFPDNPANSNLACCTPEFYTTVVSCKNYLNPAPECNPSINLSELGTNGDMKFFFAVTLIMVGIFTLYLIISLYYMWGIDDLMQYGDPDSPFEQFRSPLASFATSRSSSGGGGAYTAIPPPPPPSSDLLTSRAAAWNVIQTRK